MIYKFCSNTIGKCQSTCKKTTSAEIVMSDLKTGFNFYRNISAKV